MICPMPPPALRSKQPKPPRRPGQWRLRLGRIAANLLLLLLVALAAAAMQSDRWNPFSPLDPLAAPNLVTPFKLARTLRDPALCSAALGRIASSPSLLAPREDTDLCHIRQRVRLTEVAGLALAPVETRCDTALRLSMWAEHGVKPAARRHLGADAAGLLHFSSYACRPIRTSRGTGTAMSAHATARAIDISGVALSDGRRLMLQSGWQAGPAEQAFWRALRDTGCTYFRTALSPDYNALHADHFHFAQGRWPACR